MSVLDTFRLDGKVALVTGASRGLGRGIAAGLAEAGADVALLDRLECSGTAGEIENFGRRVCEIRRDLLGVKSGAAEEIVGECVEKLGGLDVLVNNAGIIRRAEALEFPEEDWEDVIGVNLGVVFYLSQAAARSFVAGGKRGSIINLASVLSYQGGILVPSYSAAKGAVANLTRALANEWAGRGIRVNAIAPSYFTTELTENIREDPARSDVLLSRIPAGRYGEPEDLKGAAVFLASEASEYVHGTVLPVDGGWLAR